MNQQEIMILALKGAIAELPEDQRHAIAEIKAHVEGLVKEHGDLASLAIILLSAELAAAVNGRLG